MSLPGNSDPPEDFSMRFSMSVSRGGVHALLLLATCAALSGCASDYVAPSAGPYAYVRITDAWPAPSAGKDLLGNEVQRVTQAWIYPSSAECGHHEFVRTVDWIRVRADHEFVIRQALPQGVPGRLECSIAFAGQLREGQRVTYRFDARRTPGTGRDGVCTVTAMDETGGQVSPNSEALHAKPASCGYSPL